MTEAELVVALRTRYPSNEWALVSQVRDGAGWDRRTFDAVAVGLWSSRGHPVHGFECKSSRSDWRRELAKPEKAEPLVAFVNFWWVVAPLGVVDVLTLPEGWGLLEVQGGLVRTSREAPRREAKPPTMGFVAQLAKRLLAERPGKVELEATEKAGYDRGRGDEKQHQISSLSIAEAERDRLRERIRIFQEVSGLEIPAYTEYDGSQELRAYAAIVRRVVQAEGRGFDAPLRRLQAARDQAQRFIEATDELLLESRR